MLNNILLCTDTYKLSHMLQYPDDATEVYSYLEARKLGHKTIFFGLQYYLMEYLSRPVTLEHADEFIKYYQNILNCKAPQKVIDNIYALARLGYWPVEIKAVKEGTLIETGNALLTIKNTLPGFHWCVGFLESLLLKVWNTCTVATHSYQYKLLVSQYANETCDNNDHLLYQVHDFGYRGVSSEETAMLSGGAHLVSFLGSDTITANKFIQEYYKPISINTPISASVPASEHSVMCSYGKAGEIEAFKHMLNIYPTGIMSIVSDTYDLWNVLENFTEELRPEIENRQGKVVFRPDSGNPVFIICGDPSAPFESPEFKGAMQILWEKFGGKVNSKGYKVLNPKVGLIYGDGMYYERFETMLETLKQNGFASSNIVIGVGGILLQNHNRDEYGFALKATRIVRNNEEINIFKDPITDRTKKSKSGLMCLNKNLNGNFETQDKVSNDLEQSGHLARVFMDGKLYNEQSIESVRLTASNGFAHVCKKGE